MADMETNQAPHEFVSATPPTFAPDDVRNWISDICSKFIISPSYLAKIAKVSPSTINKFLNGTAPSKNLSGSSMMSIGIAIEKLSQETEGISVIKNNAETNPALRLIYNNKTESAPVCGIVGSGMFSSPFFADKENQRYTVFVPRILRDGEDDLIAFELREEGNRIYPNGTILITRGWNDPNVRLASGDRLVVIRLASQGAETGETLVYEFQADPRGNGWLLPTSEQALPNLTIFMGTETRLNHPEYGACLIVASIQLEPNNPVA